MKKIAALIFLIPLTSCFQTPAQGTTHITQTFYSNSQPALTGSKPHETVYDILEKKVPLVAQKYLGKAYGYGANPDKSSKSDCSNLLCAITRNSVKGFGFKFKPYYFSTKKIYANSFKIEYPGIRVGDIIFFNNTSRGKNDHAGIITGIKKNTVSFIHASSKKGVVKVTNHSNSWKYYFKKKFDSFRRWNEKVFIETDLKK